MRRLRQDPSILFWEGSDRPGHVLVRVAPTAFRRFERAIDRQLLSLLASWHRPSLAALRLGDALSVVEGTDCE